MTDTFYLVLDNQGNALAVVKDRRNVSEVLTKMVRVKTGDPYAEVFAIDRTESEEKEYRVTCTNGLGDHFDLLLKPIDVY